MSSKDDILVYDGELGWIDPEDILGSLGIEFIETKDEYRYRNLDNNGRLGCRELWMPKDLDSLNVLQACLDDAKARARIEDRP